MPVYKQVVVFKSLCIVEIKDKTLNRVSFSYVKNLNPFWGSRKYGNTEKYIAYRDDLYVLFINNWNYKTQYCNMVECKKNEGKCNSNLGFITRLFCSYVLYCYQPAGRSDKGRAALLTNGIA